MKLSDIFIIARRQPERRKQCTGPKLSDRIFSSVLGFGIIAPGFAELPEIDPLAVLVRAGFGLPFVLYAVGVFGDV